MAEQVVFGEVTKTPQRQTVRVRLTEWNGRRFVDVRLFVAPAAGNGDGEPVPTKKGLSLPPDEWRRLLPIIEQAVAAAEEGKRET